MTWVQVTGGIKFDYLNPHPDMITLKGIATSLANTCRWGGHVTRFYSVAEHSLNVLRMVEQSPGWAYKREALLHDAAEAYIGDIPRPLKLLLGDQLRTIECEIEAVIASKYGLVYPWPSDVMCVDDRWLVTEKLHLLGDQDVMWETDLGAPYPGQTIAGMSPRQAFTAFNGALRELNLSD